MSTPQSPPVLADFTGYGVHTFGSRCRSRSPLGRGRSTGGRARRPARALGRTRSGCRVHGLCCRDGRDVRLCARRSAHPRMVRGARGRAAPDRVRGRRRPDAAGAARARADAALLVPPALVPALMVARDTCSRACPMRSRARRWFLPSSVADAWFAVGPALVVCIVRRYPTASGRQGRAARRGRRRADRPRTLSAAAVRLRVGLGLALRDQFIRVRVGLPRRRPAHSDRPPRGRRRGRHAVGGRRRAAARRAARRLRARAPRADRERSCASPHGRGERGAAGVDRAELERPHRDRRADGAIRTLTGATDTVFGAERQAAVGRPANEWAHPDDASLVLRCSPASRPPTAVLARGRVAHPPRRRHVRLRGDGRHRPARRRARSRHRADRARHRRARKRSRSSCAIAPSTIPLTQLANRALFYDRIEHALARERRAEQHVARALRRPRRLQG